MLTSQVLPFGRIVLTGDSGKACRRVMGCAVRASNAASPEYITSTTNALVKHCVKLRESARYRNEQRTLLLVGSTLIGEAAGRQMLICCSETSLPRQQ